MGLVQSCTTLMTPISMLTFNPSSCVESITEDWSHTKRDLDEDHVDIFYEASTPQSKSHEPEP